MPDLNASLAVLGLITFGTLTSLAAKAGKWRVCGPVHMCIVVQHSCHRWHSAAGLDACMAMTRNASIHSLLHVAVVYELDGTTRKGEHALFQKPWAMTSVGLYTAICSGGSPCDPLAWCNHYRQHSHGMACR